MALASVAAMIGRRRLVGVGVDVTVADRFATTTRRWPRLLSRRWTRAGAGSSEATAAATGAQGENRDEGEPDGADDAQPSLDQAGGRGS